MDSTDAPLFNPITWRPYAPKDITQKTYEYYFCHQRKTTDFRLLLIFHSTMNSLAFMESLI
jgi:hypothetical protein